MHLALVTRRYPPLIGGAEKVFSYLAAALAREGAEVTVLTSLSEGLPEREELLVPRGRLTIVRLPTSSRRIVGTLRYMANLRRWFDRNATDLAYVSMLKHDAYVAVGVGRHKRFPVVLRPEGAGATGDLAWQSWGRFGQLIGRRCRMADAVISIAPAITAELRGARYRPEQIHEVPNGVPVPQRSWLRRADWNTQPRAVFVGRLAPEKRIGTLLEAWAQGVKPVLPDSRLVLIGDGPERPALESQIERLGIRDVVELAGSIDDPVARLRDADLFVLPSAEEGMSIALLEAMALGIPVVATAIPGNRRLIDDGRHGLLVAPDDPGALARGIVSQWGDFDRAVQMGRLARARVVQEFSITAVAQMHLTLFQRLIREKRSLEA
jgi:glycosyltransferase involved in cell wall biosynthesis